MLVNFAKNSNTIPYMNCRNKNSHIYKCDEGESEHDNRTELPILAEAHIIPMCSLAIKHFDIFACFRLQRWFFLEILDDCKSECANIENYTHIYIYIERVKKREREREVGRKRK